MCGRAPPVTSTSCGRQKLSETRRGSLLLHFFRLPEGDGRTGWVAENAHLAITHDLADIDDDFGTEGFCLDGGGIDVVDANVRQPHRGCAGHRVFHHAADRVITILDEGVVHAHTGDVLELPVEEL